MSQTIDETSALSTTTAAEETESSEGLYLARRCALEEAIGLTFGLMTVAYIVLSLTGLIP